jgi:hypothetical protein
MSNQKNSVFSTLSSVAIKDKVERKGNIDYLSWAYAWSLLKQHYPTAQRVVYEDPATGWNYFSDGRTAWVKVGVIVEEQEHIDYLPIMDFRNQAIPVDRVNQFEVNKAIQRSTAKAIAMHGLGLQLWTGEDIPELTTSAPAPAAPKKAAQKKEQEDDGLIELNVGDANWEKVVKYIETNASLGVEKIGKQLVRKYRMTPDLKKTIVELINTHTK